MLRAEELAAHREGLTQDGFGSGQVFSQIQRDAEIGECFRDARMLLTMEFPQAGQRLAIDLFGRGRIAAI